jgi:hypothetical protein
MIDQSPIAPKAAPRHPFLGLAPEARRQLARVLLAGMETAQDAELSRQSRHGLAGGVALGAIGAGLYQGWYHLTGLDAGPFAVWYGGYLAVQAGIGAHLAKRGHALGPQAVRWLVLAPAEGLAAARSWLFPEKLRPDRLVLAGGILVATRHPVSYHLLRRLYGRAYPQAEVDKAITILRHLGLVLVKQREGSTVLLLAPAGVQLLHELGVPDPEPRPRQDPAIAPHLRPIFVALDKPGLRRVMPLRDAPDQLVAHDLAPAAAASAPAPVEAPRPVSPPVEAMPWEIEPAEPEPVAPEPEPEPVAVTATIHRFPTPVHDAPDVDEDDETAPVVRRPVRLPKRALAVAGAIAAVGLIAVTAVKLWPQAPGTRPVNVTSAMMPSSLGKALQFNGRGLMLSSYKGDLFLSVADRLDYKRPMSFQGFDMADTCGLKAGAIRAASMSPNGRFLFLELGKAERCLVDLETKTVHHDLKAKNPSYGLPALVGWVGESTLLMSEEANVHQAGRWWLMDVTTHKGTALELPRHGRAMLMPMPTGAPLLVGLDLKRLGEWQMTTYWLDEKKQWQKLQSLTTTLPEELHEAEPMQAAISPDKRYVLLSLRPVGGVAPAKGSLAVVSLADGHATMMNGGVAAEGPIFWGPEVISGRYRFYYNGSTPDGDSPGTGEVQAAP